MSKPLDHEELWDSFTIGERQALLVQIPKNREYKTQPPCDETKWRFLPTTLRFELQALDWEFSLGKRFAPPA